MGRYAIKEVFNTLQGEGSRVGQRSVFVRFSGCNLWDGRPLNREDGAGACALWCDTDFFKGRVLELEELLEKMDVAWTPTGGERWCVLSGGEPLLQVDAALLDALHDAGWKIAIETNGTIDPGVLIRGRLDHICVSPKRGTLPTKLLEAHELKVVLPGCAPDRPAEGWTEEQLLELASAGHWGRMFVQPQDPIIDPTIVELTALKPSDAVDSETLDIVAAAYAHHLQRCIEWVMRHPAWALSFQAHKYLSLP